jgi:hypothetical protein
MLCEVTVGAQKYDSIISVSTGRRDCHAMSK